jgi:hypothetical protein
MFSPDLPERSKGESRLKGVTRAAPQVFTPGAQCGCYAAGMSSDRSHARMTWALVVLALGALVGIGTTAALLARKDRPLPDDPDAPLFI